MENWKTALVAGSVVTGLILLLKGKRSAALVVAGIGAATLAAEYPDKFAEIRDNAEHYMTRGITFLTSPPASAGDLDATEGGQAVAGSSDFWSKLRLASS